MAYKEISPYATDEDALYSRFRSDKPTYAGTLDNDLTKLYEQITTRPGFKYDVGTDPLYQQYRDQYIQHGKLAMKDTMGQAAALTGGYGSSYGQSVGQQAYDAYLQSLSEAVPELYSAAYGRYQDEGNKLLQQYQMLGQQRDAEYGRYRDAMSDWESERAYQTQLENEEYNRRLAEENAAYSRQQQAYANLYALIGSTGYQPTDNELAATGMTRAAADALRAEYTRSITPTVTYSSGGGGGGRSSGSSSGNSTADIQRQLNAMGANLDVDGIWGPLTQAAYEKYMGGGDRTVNVNGKQTTLNSYGEVRTGNNPTRGETARAAQQAYSSGQITYAEYKTIMNTVR